MSATSQAKTKTIRTGTVANVPQTKELTADQFAKVDDPDDPGTWSYAMDNNDRTRFSLGKLWRAPHFTGKTEVARKLLAAAKSFGIDNMPIVDAFNELLPTLPQLEQQAQDAIFSQGADDDNYDCAGVNVDPSGQGELQAALLDKFGGDPSLNGAALYVLVKAFPDYVLARRPDGKLYQIAYTIDGQGKPVLGEPQEVKERYSPPVGPAMLSISAGTFHGSSLQKWLLARRAKHQREAKEAADMAVVTLEVNDKAQLAMDGMLGVREARSSGIRPFRGLREAYEHVTGDHGLRYLGGSDFWWKTSESAALTSTFPNLLLNSMTKRLLQDYAELGMGSLEQIVTYADTRDFKTQDRVRMGYLGELSTVAEDAPYTDFALVGDERVHYNPTKRGNTLPVTRETMLNDDLGKIQTFVARIARASRKTLKRFITNFLVNNGNYDVDGASWFNAAHNNLGSAPLSVLALIAAEVSLANQTEQNSGEMLGLTLDWIAVPFSLKAAAYQINNAQFYNPGPGIQVPNPFWQRFGENGERIIVNEMFVGDPSPHSWYYGTLPANAPFLEVGFVQGQREPVIVLQNEPTQGAVFTNEVLTYKVRHEYGGDMTDFRGIGKNVVP
jgi:hypothetical protein